MVGFRGQVSLVLCTEKYRRSRWAFGLCRESGSEKQPASESPGFFFLWLLLEELLQGQAGSKQRLVPRLSTP